jgi:hypothetical protein
MQLIAPDILEDAQSFSLAVTAPAFGLGLLVWILGWRGHRFWIVLITTIGAGILGLYTGPAYGTKPIIGGVLLACAAGALALSLVRVVAFGAGGIAAWLLLRSLAPSWEEPLVCFLVGGLIGLLLFRLWTMVLTSSTGTLLMVYSGLCLAHTSANVDIVALAGSHALLLNGLCGGLVLVGLGAQLLVDRQRARQQRRRGSRGSGVSAPSYQSSPWWSWGQKPYRRAG